MAGRRDCATACAQRWRSGFVAALRSETSVAVCARDNLAIAVKLASMPDDVRGYGHVKERHVALAKAKQSQLLADFNDPQAAKARGAAQVVQFV